MTREEACKRFRDRVNDREQEVDPEQERDWFDLAYGFFLALDFEPSAASSMAVHVTAEDMEAER